MASTPRPLVSRIISAAKSALREEYMRLLGMP